MTAPTLPNLPLRKRPIDVVFAVFFTLFIVTSCNQDFNVARLERYLTLAHEAEITPVIEVDRRRIGNGRPGPLTRQLQQAFFACVRGEDARHADWLTLAKNH